MQAIRYRSGIDASSGRIITGRKHLAQSIATIWATRPGERIMLLSFGSNLRSHLAEDITGPLALEIYDDLIQTVIDWEPEYRIAEMQLVSLTLKGGLGIQHGGIYYPEGRFGNYAISEKFGRVTDLAQYERLARSASATRRAV